MPLIILFSIIITTVISTVAAFWDKIISNQEMKVTILFWAGVLVVVLIAYMIYFIKELIETKKEAARRKKIMEKF